ncbi:hypothetical protein VTJ49DRAFT_1995 [Mycothermus thermophilus]|uniref:DUF1754-domain-containing protein n=1 Tax=Humicola insolens TaxID=85995 RepID=A0ABR3VB75_HUMIN
MPSDEYASVARGPLKLKGAAGVTKKKKKKTKDKTDLEKNLSTGSDEKAIVPAGDETKSRSRSPDEQQDPDRKKKKHVEQKEGGEGEEEEDDEVAKTEAERRFAEARRKRLKELTESGRIRPELLKTHKQRVEELNAHLARLSEHHDMPKIGPG